MKKVFTDAQVIKAMILLVVVLLLAIPLLLSLTLPRRMDKAEESTETTTTTLTTTEITTTTIQETTMTTTTVVTTTSLILTIDENVKEPDYVLFDWSNRTVHTKDCSCIDPDQCQKMYGYEKGFFISEGRPCSKCKPIVTIGRVFIPDESYLELAADTTITYYGDYDYSPVYGASGRELITYFSAASDSIPLGSYVYVKSADGTIDACYRIDDTGPGYGRIDLYYETYDMVQPKLRSDGTMPCQVWIIRDPDD